MRRRDLMQEATSTTRGHPSYARLVACPLLVLAALGAVARFGLVRSESKASVEDRRETPVIAAMPPAPEETPPEPPPPPAPRPREPDRAAIARAEEELESLRRDRARAERRAAEAAEQLRAAELAAVERARAARSVTSQLRDPTPRIEKAQASLAALSAESRRIGDEIAALVRVPKPRAKPLIDQTPVARPPRGEEYHFEVRADRVAFIDLERLLESLKTDARIQLRLQSIPRAVGGEAGPVGAFAIRYEITPTGLDYSSGLGGRGLSAEYGLSGWEIVPVRDPRGETIAEALGPASDFLRAINRLDPDRDAVTLWVYPDGFTLYRRLRDELHHRGFLVAARPLPAGLPIRGSPVGSTSAGQ
jgi:hypothetical protein